MRRTGLGLVLALAVGLVAGCGGGGKSAGTTAPTTTAPPVPTITLRISKAIVGPWSEGISLKLTKGPTPTSYFVCGTWKHAPPTRECEAATGASLPPGTSLRLEQRPAGSALPVAGSPGWGTVASADVPLLDAALSTFVAGNKAGHLTYRMTLRNRNSGHVVATSNSVTLDLHD
jgi:hypothetical protein